jgi:hypothetical protein
MRQKGSWPLLINLEREELANVLKPEGQPAKRLRFAPTALDRVQLLAVHGPADCRVCTYGIETPAINGYTLKESKDNWLRRSWGR